MCDNICKEGLGMNGSLHSLCATMTEYLKRIFYKDKKFALISDLEVEIQEHASSSAWLQGSLLAPSHCGGCRNGRIASTV